jgi:hypothetical protein
MCWLLAEMIQLPPYRDREVRSCERWAATGGLDTARYGYGDAVAQRKGPVAGGKGSTGNAITGAERTIQEQH